MTGPGITERCTPEQPCPKSLDPAGISWVDGCWCYRNRADDEVQPMKVWVVVSDCGLNGPWIHGVYTSEPDRATIEKFTHTRHTDPEGATFCVASTTGYAFTSVETFELDGELR